jgi:hypothetical protein
MVAPAVSLSTMPWGVIWRPRSDSSAAKYAVGVKSDPDWGCCWLRRTDSMDDSRRCVWSS